MAKISFSHPLIRPSLYVETAPDQVTWAYGLNTATYPTYGGEVVQILSVFFDDMTVAGTVSSYAELEAIYSWFIGYMQEATQGRDNPSHDQHPVTFTYYERNWTFMIWPKALPGFRYGRDVVAPEWKLVAAVKEPDAVLANQIVQAKAFNAAHSGQFDTFGLATADFGKTGDLENNPWASPDADPSHKGSTINQWISQNITHLADTFNGFTSDYADHNYSALPQFSKPPDYLGKPASGTTTKKATATTTTQKGNPPPKTATPKKNTANTAGLL